MRRKTSSKTTKTKNRNTLKKPGAFKEETEKSAIPKNTAHKERLRVDSKQSKWEFLEERLKFEMLLADISSRFINLHANQVDNQIEGAMKDVCQFLGLDLSALWQWSEEDLKFLTMTHLYRPLGGPPVPEKMDAHKYFPWALQQMMAGKIIALSSVDSAPEEASRDKETWCYFGIKNALVFPLSIGGTTTIGAISFHAMLAECSWPETIVKRLQLVSEIFTNALSRKLMDEKLRQREESLILATEAADTGLWILNVDSGIFWCTKKAQELFRFDPDTVITMDRFLSVVHTEDRERIRHVIEKSIRERNKINVEYRIVHPDGRIRWIASWGRSHKKPSDESNLMMGVSLDITERKQMEKQLQAQFQEIENLKQRLEKENVYLKEECKVQHCQDEIVGESEALKRVLVQAEKVAQTESTVLILGETGTGKELIAHAIHNSSTRSRRLMIKVDCASLPSALIESELFGREKGAYTGALTKQVGRFELADGSTIFLDEIGDLPLELQAKLLRVLQSGEFERLGSPHTVHVDVRIIAATNRNLEEAVKKQTFREDLYHRLKVFPIEVPPLRKRHEDIPLLVHTFVNELSGKMGKKIRTVPEHVMEIMKQYHWPGNVRELRNLIERAVIISDGDMLMVHVPDRLPERAMGVIPLEKAERRHIAEALEKTGWRIKGRDGAAELLGLKPSTLYSKMEKLGIPTHRERR